MLGVKIRQRTVKRSPYFDDVILTPAIGCDGRNIKLLVNLERTSFSGIYLLHVAAGVSHVLNEHIGCKIIFVYYTGL